MEKMNKENFKNNFMQIIIASVISIITSLMLIFVFSIILTYTNVKETLISPVLIVITVISVLIGSSLCSKKIKRNGLINGGIIGIIYIGIIYLISSIIGTGFLLNINSIIMIILTIISGMIGGIIGVNNK